MKQRVLFIGVRSKNAYEGSLAKVPYFPMLTYPALAAPLRDAGHECMILDLNLYENSDLELIRRLKSFEPTHVCISFTTPYFFEVQSLVKEIKAFNDEIIVICGGAHASALPKYTFENLLIDILVVGEGDFTLVDIVSGKNIAKIKGIYYKKGDKIVKTPSRKFISDLDKLPFPAWDLIDQKKLRKEKYHRSFFRSFPTALMESTRGCSFYSSCYYCSPKFGTSFRTKTSKRVLKEIKLLNELGYKDIQLADDNFTQNLDRAKKICIAVEKSNLDIYLNLANGIRVDRVDSEFLGLAKRAGCYYVSFGVESGSQKLLDSLNKRINLQQTMQAFKKAKSYGLDTCALCVFGNPDETEETMKETISFVNKINPTFARVTIFIPYPGTRFWNEWKKEHRILTEDWTLYNFHNNKHPIYDHPNLDSKLLFLYYNLFYKKFYLRFPYIYNRFIYGLKNGTLLSDFYYLSKVFRDKLVTKGF